MHTLKGAVRFATIMAVAVMFVGTARADHHVVKVAKNEKLGSYLTDAKGISLYTFKKDTAGKSACAGDCVTKWPLYYREQVGVTGDLQAADFATITREDGQKQTTYKGMPLYYFSGDKAASDTKGQGFKDLWTVAAP